MAADLRNHLDGRPIVARPVGRAERAWKLLRRHPVVAALAGLLFVALAAYGVTATALYRRADRQYRRADGFARQARAETLDKLTASARAALARGQLALAETDYDRALELAPEGERLGLEVERLRTLTAYGRVGRLQSELDRFIESEGLTDTQRATVLLYAGDLDLQERLPWKEKRGRERLEKALAIGEGLRGGDAEYARGVLAPGTTGAVAAFERAVKAEPFHYRANCALVVELAMSGQREAARRHARFMEQAFVAEPVAPLALTLAATLAEDVAEAKSQRELLKGRISPEQLKDFDLALVPFQVAARMGRGENVDVFAALRKQAKVGNGGANPLDRLPEAAGVGLPILDRFERLRGALTRGYTALILGKLDDADAELTPLLPLYPESLLRNMAGGVAAARSARAGTRGDALGMLDHSARASPLFREAADAPTVAPTGQMGRQAVWTRFMIHRAAEHQKRTMHGQTICTCANAPSVLFALGPLAFDEAAARRGPPVGDEELARRVAERDPPGYVNGLRTNILPRMIGMLDADEARHLLRCWLRDEPRAAVPIRLLAELELKQGSPRRALEWAARGQSLHPFDWTFWRLRANARQAVDALPSSPK